MRAFHVVVSLSIAACGGSEADPTPPDAAPPPDVALAIACTDTAEGLYAAPPASLAPFDASHRGEVFRCTRDRWIDAETLDTTARANGYVGAPLTSGATIVRIAYRTERAQVGATAAEGHSSAFVLVPDAPHTPGALVVYGDPSVGIAPSCAPTHIDLSAQDDGWEQTRAPLLALVGAGWTVVAPDRAGFGFGDAPSYCDAEDEAKSLLDATRAVANLLPGDLVPAKVVLVGHSIGGHATLSAHALAPTYGLRGELIGVANFAPFWLSNLAWGAMLSPASGFTTTNAPYALEFQLDYFYAHGELLDGTGHGLDLIQVDKRAQVQDLLSGACLSGVAAGLVNLGDTAADYFDPIAVDALSRCGFTGDCTIDPAPLWEARFLADRPPIDAAGPPIVLWFGGQDATVTPEYARCAVEKIERDLGTSGTTQVTVCNDADAGHEAVPPRDVGWVNDWIGARLTGDAAPTCTAPVPPSDGGPACPSVPPNL